MNQEAVHGQYKQQGHYRGIDNWCGNKKLAVQNDYAFVVSLRTLNHIA
jgi:hypothetical protein